MSRTGTDLLNLPASRSQPFPRRSTGLGRDDGLLVVLGAAALVWLGCLAYFLGVMGTALP
jgi:hypothetical protein